MPIGKPSPGTGNVGKPTSKTQGQKMDDDQDQYWTRPNASAKDFGKQGPATTTSPDRADLDRSNWIRKSAQQVLSSYRRDDFADPDSYVVQLAMVLERFSDSTIREATSPVTGIQRHCKFPPSIAECVEFLDNLKRRAEFPSQWDERSRKQIEERAEFERNHKTETPEHRRAVVERLVAEMRGRGFQFADNTTEPTKTFRQYTADELEAMYGRPNSAEEGKAP
jgi:hypothetical protein